MTLLTTAWRRLLDRVALGRRRRDDRLADMVCKRRDAFRTWDAATIRAHAGERKASARSPQLSDAWIVECLALACEAARRSIELDPHPVQVLAALHLHSGRIVEMATGEGKTLVAALAACVAAAGGRRVHVVTANDYLARRDATWMSALYAIFGLSAGCRLRGQSGDERHAAYACNIVYGTAAEIGFDDLIDGIRRDADGRTCRGFGMAIIDEIDHILLDEASNPLVITGDLPVDEAICRAADEFAAVLTPKHTEIDRPRREIWLSDTGLHSAESWFAARGFLQGTGLYDRPNLAAANRIGQALRARWLMSRDVDYMVQEDKIAVLDTRTGRPTRGRFPDGLQQALEVREGVALTPEQRPVAALSLRAFARLYAQLSGMTATAAADAPELADVYGLAVVTISRAVASRRIDREDRIYETEARKLEAIADLIAARHAHGQPILIGTTTIGKSEDLSALLAARELRHQILHAHFLEQEAAIIAEAGRRGAITIATKMAGRGTDIELGGSRTAGGDAPRNSDAETAAERDAIRAAGGLLVIGAERHRLRRLDEQLRGRAGRRGDPGETVFFVSLEDALLQSVRGAGLDTRAAQSARGEDGRLLDPDLPRIVATLQAKNQAADAAGRRSVRPYDEIMDQQWRVFQRLRDSLLLSSIPQDTDIARVFGAAAAFAGVDPSLATSSAAGPFPEAVALGRRLVHILDGHWQEHVLRLDVLRQGIGWRAMGGRDPFIEYGKDAFAEFDEALNHARAGFAAALVAGA